MSERNRYRPLSRRMFLVGGSASLLGGCMSTLDLEIPALDMDSTGTVRPRISVDPNVRSPALMYASISEGPHQIPEVPVDKIPRAFRRQIVPDPTGEAPGTIVVDLANHHLYLIQPGGDALRYGVGIGRAGFEWKGRANIQYKREWPTWTPPREMIARQPEVAQWAGGQPGGIANPLGARALYIFKDGVDTGYRIHGSPEWWTIGQNMSSGCVRMINQDVIDLYNRVPGKAPVVVG